MKVVLAEKHSVAMDIARVLGATSKKDGFIEGNGYALTWAIGHLVQLAPPEVYGFGQWDISALPMIPDEFKLLPIQAKEKGEKDFHDDPGKLKQLKVISSLFKDASEIIVATDSGKEGELIFRYIYTYLGCKKPFKRLWIRSQTDAAIKKGFSELKDGSAYNRLYEAAKSRSESDWLVGLNATRALTLGLKSKSVFSIGRVQTPTLVMICSRYIEHTSFQGQFYYQIHLELLKGETIFPAVSKINYKEKELMESDFKKSVATGSVVVKSIDVSDHSENPPLLYDLTMLQTDANRVYGFSASHTLELAQSLYEKKLTTYPRTGSRYIDEDVFETVPLLIQNTKSLGYYPISVYEFLEKGNLCTVSVDASKVTDHHALLPTEIVFDESKVSKDELVIYKMIQSRMLESFHDTSVTKRTNVELDANNVTFIARGSELTYEGWKGINKAKKKGEEAEDQDEIELPELVLEESLKIKSAKGVTKKTKPKPLYTEGTLLTAMKTCGKQLEDLDARDAMKDIGLGTTATRDSIINRLFQTQYVGLKGKSLVPTEKGLAVYKLVNEKELGHPEMTGDWEKKLLEIENGNLEYSEFMKEIKNYTREVTKEMITSSQTVDITALQEADRIPCPKCKKGSIRVYEKAAPCSEKESCGFVIFTTVAGKKLTQSQLSDLIFKGKTAVIKGLKSTKTGNEFEARLVLDKDFKVSFEFPKKK